MWTMEPETIVTESTGQGSSSHIHHGALIQRNRLALDLNYDLLQDSSLFFLSGLKPPFCLSRALLTVLPVLLPVLPFLGRGQDMKAVVPSFQGRDSALIGTVFFAIALGGKWPVAYRTDFFVLAHFTALISHAPLILRTR